MFLWRLSNGPTLSVHRYWLKSQISQYIVLGTLGREIAQYFTPRWLPGMRSWSASSTMHLWGISQYRYASILESEEQCQTLAKSISSWFVQRTFDKCLTKERRTFVVLTPRFHDGFE